VITKLHVVVITYLKFFLAFFLRNQITHVNNRHIAIHTSTVRIDAIAIVRVLMSIGAAVTVP